MRQFQSIRILIALLLCTSLAISTEHFQFTETGQYELINLGNIYLSDDPVEEGSEVAVFDGDLCVGAVIYSGLAGQQLLAWADDPTTDELDGFTEGNLISFKVYVSSLDTVYQGLSANYIAYPGWDTSGLFHVDEVSGVNLSYDLPTQNIALSSNWNLMSLNIVPYEADSVLEILSPIHNNLIYVFDEQFNLIRWDVNDWSDGIGLWEPTEGYYIKLDSGQNLSVLASGPISMPFSIPLNTGWNIVSFPIQNVSGQSVEHVFGEIMDSIEMIFNWNGSLYLPGGDPFNMYPGKAYLVKTTQNETLVINDSGGFGTMIAEGIDANQGQFRTGHFQPVWEGTPFTPMAFVLNEAMWNYLDIEPGDEVGIFDGNICVGAFTVPDEGFAPGSQIPTSKDDGSGNGFTEGHPVSFRVWKENVVTEIDADIISFSDVVSGSSTAAVFSALSGVEVEISVQPPSMPGSFSLAGGSAQVSLSWSTPSQGNYNIYENGVPSQAIFYELYRDGSLLLESFQTNNYTDSGLSHNTLYEYELKAVSVVDDSESSSNSSLTLPGVPVFSPHVADINEVLLSWVDAESSGNDSEIVYSLMRKWLVDGYEYNESLVSNYDQYDFIDQTLLNSSEFFYRVKAKNATGFSSWSGYSPVTNLSPPSGVPDAVELLYDEITQTYVPPQNLVTLSWSESTGAISYRIYERNILVVQDILGTHFTDGLADSGHLLQTNSQYRYVVTATNSEGESSPSDVWISTTLPEIAPPVAPDFSVTGGQNQNSLSWSPAYGPGDPVGGNAVSYKIYRFGIDEFDPENISGDDVIGSTGSTSYYDNNLEDNSLFCYAVSGVNSEGLEGELTGILCASTNTQLPPSTPQNVSASGGNQQISIGWSSSVGSPPITYQIYRYGNLFIGETSSTSFTDQGLSKNSE